MRNGILMMLSPALLVTLTEVKSGIMLQNTVTAGVKSICMTCMYGGCIRETELAKGC